jgi:hypothetical protein
LDTGYPDFDRAKTNICVLTLWPSSVANGFWQMIQVDSAESSLVDGWMEHPQAEEERIVP